MRGEGCESRTGALRALRFSDAAQTPSQRPTARSRISLAALSEVSIPAQCECSSPLGLVHPGGIPDPRAMVSRGVALWNTPQNKLTRHSQLIGWGQDSAKGGRPQANQQHPPSTDARMAE